MEKEMISGITSIITEVGVPIAVMSYYLIKDYIHGNKILEACNNIVKAQGDQVSAQREFTEALKKLTDKIQGQNDKLISVCTKLGISI